MLSEPLPSPDGFVFYLPTLLLKPRESLQKAPGSSRRSIHLSSFVKWLLLSLFFFGVRLQGFRDLSGRRYRGSIHARVHLSINPFARRYIFSNQLLRHLQNRFPIAFGFLSWCGETFPPRRRRRTAAADDDDDDDDEDNDDGATMTHAVHSARVNWKWRDLRGYRSALHQSELGIARPLRIPQFTLPE